MVFKKVFSYFYKMKKVKRIIFCVILSCIFLGTIYSSYNTYNLFTRNIDRNPNILPPLFFGVFSLLGLLFNLKKLITTVYLNKIIYSILRFGDFIFSIVISIFLIININYRTNNFIVQESSFGTYFLRLLMLLSMLTLYILLFLDNLKYHKEQKKGKEFEKTLLINEIGK